MSKNKRRLLVVDDNIDFADIVVTAAEARGFEVRVAGNGRRATELCRSFIPDTVVLDIVMPDMDGMEFMDWLAKNGYEPQLIVISGYSRYTDLAKKMAGLKGLTLAAVLPKPVRLPLLVAALDA